MSIKFISQQRQDDMDSVFTKRDPHTYVALTYVGQHSSSDFQRRRTQQLSVVTHEIENKRSSNEEHLMMSGVTSVTHKTLAVNGTMF